ncbi:MAG: bifunctional hydroxymethylpyrimidine kinase/phosphomethylpyrimidine kinase [Halobacteria archaeon]|nr:bifunctional hydroxymethylpyrimidine kinase/phosphomethylpyrimidine kinase [Halobacteria archaeon]
MEVALTVAGSDSGGGAGIQADLKTFEARGVFGTSAVTNLTAQNTVGVDSVYPVPPDEVVAQIDSVVSDFDVGAVKTGMLGSPEIIEAVADKLRQNDLPLVVDPVMVAQSGDRLLDEDAEEVLRRELVPEASLVTPNIPEAEVLADVEVHDEKSMERAAKIITESLGADAALVKGGHSETEADDREIVDVLRLSNSRKFYKERLETEKTHGTGCALSSAVTAELAKGEDLQTAVARGEEFIHRAIRYGLELGEGNGPVHHMSGLRNRASELETVAKVRDAVETFESEDISRVVPEVGTNFAVTTPYAVSVDEVAAVEGRISRLSDGVKATSGAWLGASSHVARFLLGVRDYDESVNAAANLRLDDRIEKAVDSLNWDVVEFDRSEEPERIKSTEGSTMSWSAKVVMEGRGEAPDAVLDRGDVGKESMVRLLADSADEAVERVLELDDEAGV